MELRSDEWRIQHDQVPAWTPEGELSFTIDRTMPPRADGARAYRLTGELLVPRSALPPALLDAANAHAVERTKKEAQQVIDEAGLLGAGAIAALALVRGNPLVSGGRRGTLADAGFVRIDLAVPDATSGRARHHNGYIRLSPYPLTGEVKAGVKRLLLSTPT